MGWLDKYEKAQKGIKSYKEAPPEVARDNTYVKPIHRPMSKEEIEMRRAEAEQRRIANQPVFKPISESEIKRRKEQTKAINEDELSIFEKPLIYMANPLKLLGDLAQPFVDHSEGHLTKNPFPTSEEDRLSIAKNRHLPGGKSKLEQGLEYVPSAALNAAGDIGTYNFMLRGVRGGLNKVFQTTNMTRPAMSYLDETAGYLFRDKANKAAVKRGQDWLENWTSHPATQKRIENAFSMNQQATGAPMRNRLKDMMLQLDIEKYKPFVGEYPLSNQFQELTKLNKNLHIGNSGVSYTHGAGYSNMPIAERALQNPLKGSWVSRSLKIPQAKRELTTIHEGTHDWFKNKALSQSGLNQAIQSPYTHDEKLRLMNWKLSQVTNIPFPGNRHQRFAAYISDPAEMHARTMELRRQYNLAPDTEITSKMAKDMLLDRHNWQISGQKEFVELIKHNPVNLQNLLKYLPAATGVGVGVGAMNQEETPNEFQEGGKVPKRVGVRKNPDGSVSSHLMRAEKLPNGDWVGFPSLFQNKDSTWVDMSKENNWMKIYEEALKRKEVRNFGKDSISAINYGKGSWKKFQKGGVIEDDRGQWAHPGEITKINSNQITMKGVDYPVLGISDSGDAQLMKPGGEYRFEGKSVTEFPIKAQDGKKLWLDEYETQVDNTRVSQPLIKELSPKKTLKLTDTPVSDTDLREFNFIKKDDTAISIPGRDSLLSKKISPKEAWLDDVEEPSLTESVDDLYLQFEEDEKVVQREYKYDGIDYGGNARKFQEEQNRDKTIDTYYLKYNNETKSEVESIQEDLKAKGYDPGVIDGKFGKNTRKAYEDMMSDVNLDKNVIDKYYKKYFDKDTDTREKVIDIQNNLISKGLLKEGEADGKFGDKTRDAVLKYNLNNPEQGELFSSKNIKEIKKLDTEWCARGMADVLDNEGVNTTSIGIRGVDAWHMNARMASKPGYQSVYNIYEEHAGDFKNVKSGADLVAATDKVKRKSQTDATMYRKGDIVGLYWRGSEHQDDTAVLKSKTKNTHVGFVSDIVDGVPIITHNVGSTLHHDPYTKLQTAWISRNTEMMSAPTRAEVSTDNYDASEFIQNFETQIERPLVEKEKKVVQNIYDRASYNSENLPNELGSSVDSEWLKEATIGVIRLESTLGLKADYSKEDFSLDRKLAHKIKGTPEKNISYGIGKAKVSHLDRFAKKYFGVTKPEDLKDVNKGTDLVSYRLLKNYDKFKDYANKFPELNLTEEDIQNMSILAYNQGTSKLLKTGRVDDDRSIKEELEALRSLYTGNVKDISSTNWRYLKKLGFTGLANKLYDKENPEGHESYISRVNRHSSELLASNKLASMQNGGKIQSNWLDQFN